MFVDALKQSQAENRRLTRILYVVIGLAAFAMLGWKTAPTNLTAHIPPDLRNGAKIKVGSSAPDVPDATVYTFAFYMWQQINRWQTDGAKDYGDQIFAMQAFLTPSCRSQLVADMNQRSNAGELTRRTRSVMEIPGLGYTQERVAINGGNAWKVLLDTQVIETQANVAVKDTFIRYPLRVVRFDVDRERNPWQLAIDCFGGDRPARLDAKAVAVAKSSHNVAEVRTDALAPALSADASAVVINAPPTAVNNSAGQRTDATTNVSTSTAQEIAPVNLPRPSN